jgi:hypothetical protein
MLKSRGVKSSGAVAQIILDSFNGESLVDARPQLIDFTSPPFL